MVGIITFNFCRERQFFGGGSPGAQTVPPPPAIAPAPVPTQTNSTPTLEGRQQQVAMLKYGALSTISNTGGAAGITGQGSDLYPTMTPGTRGTTGGQ